MGTASLMIPSAHGSIIAATAFLSAAQMGDISWPVYHVNELSLRQVITPEHLLGRVNAAMQMLSRGLLPVGSLCGGASAFVIGMRSTLALGAPTLGERRWSVNPRRRGRGIRATLRALACGLRLRCTRRGPTLVPLRVHNPNLSTAANCLFVLVIEVVVGSVRHELGLTHSADGSGSRSSVGV